MMLQDVIQLLRVFYASIFPRIFRQHMSPHARRRLAHHCRSHHPHPRRYFAALPCPHCRHLLTHTSPSPLLRHFSSPRRWRAPCSSYRIPAGPTHLHLRLHQRSQGCRFRFRFRPGFWCDGDDDNGDGDSGGHWRIYVYISCAGQCPFAARHSKAKQSKANLADTNEEEKTNFERLSAMRDA